MTMQRARRLASVVVVASLGVAGLSACQSDPAVAAYVGDSERITQDRVDSVYNDVIDKLRAGSSKPVTPPITRTDVLSVLVGSELLDKVAAQQGVTAPADLQSHVADFAQALGLPADTEYATLRTKWEGLLSGLQAKVAPGKATDADFREVYDSLVAAQGIDPSTTYAAFKDQVSKDQQSSAALQQAAAVRDEVVKASTQFDIRINPRYQPAKMPVLETSNPNTQAIITLMTTPIGPNDGVAPVTDAR